MDSNTSTNWSTREVLAAYLGDELLEKFKGLEAELVNFLFRLLRDPKQKRDADFTEAVFFDMFLELARKSEPAKEKIFKTGEHLETFMDLVVSLQCTKEESEKASLLLGLEFAQEVCEKYELQAKQLSDALNGAISAFDAVRENIMGGHDSPPPLQSSPCPKATSPNKSRVETFSAEDVMELAQRSPPEKDNDEWFSTKSLSKALSRLSPKEQDRDESSSRGPSPS
jgi:hypothetical protein